MKPITNVIDAIIKSVIGNKIENDLIKELFINSYEGISENATQKWDNLIKKGSSKITYILSKDHLKTMNIPDDRIEFIIAEIEELLSKLKITNELLAECKYDNMNLSSLFWNEYLKYKNYNVEYEKEIKLCLHVVATEIIKLVQESEQFETELLISLTNSVSDANLNLHNMSDYIKEKFEELDKNSQKSFTTLHQKLEHIQENDNTHSKHEEIFYNNKKSDYIENWNSRLFLHLYDEVNPITLSKAFIVPDYEIHRSIQYLNISNTTTFDSLIEHFIKYAKSSTMLITGVPGIGKTSITSWLANKYEANTRFIILRFRDWESEEIEKGLINAIYNTLGCKKRDLDNLIIVLDGYDEMKALDIRHKLLNDFLYEIKDFKNFKCILTSRPAYINTYNFQNVINLKAFDITRVETFFEIITKDKLKCKERIENNLDVLGIPVILYMAIMSNIDISQNLSKPELYSRIFAENGGIFDKFYDGDVQYDIGMQILRNSENTKIYLDFLRNIAFLMFKKNTLILNKDEIQIPNLTLQRKSVSVLEFPIKHLFETTASNIEFIHKSVYEYFVAEYIFTSINKGIEEGDKYLANILAEIFQEGILEKEVLEFLKYKITLCDLFQDINTTFNMMLKNGLTYYSNKCYRDILNCETCILINMLEILQLFENKELKLDLSKSSYFKQNFSRLNLYKIILTKQKIPNCCLMGANLKKAILEDVDLSGANLQNVDLTEANLNRVILEGANLNGVKLVHATVTDVNLKNTNLTNADLTKINFIGGDLSSAYLQNVNLAGANLQNTYLTGLDLSKTCLNRAILTNANLSESNLTKASLIDARLEKANLRDAYLRNANLSGANLTGCILNRAYLKGVNLKNTILIGIELKEVNLTGVCLYGAILDEEQIAYLAAKQPLEGTYVYINSTKEIICYDEYSI